MSSFAEQFAFFSMNFNVLLALISSSFRLMCACVYLMHFLPLYDIEQLFRPENNIIISWNLSSCVDYCQVFFYSVVP